MHHYDIRSGIMFYAEVGRNAVGCWNSATDFSAATHDTVAQNNQTMIYPSDLSVKCFDISMNHSIQKHFIFIIFSDR